MDHSPQSNAEVNVGYEAVIKFLHTTSLQYSQHDHQARLQNCEKWLLPSSFLSAWNNSAPTGEIFLKFYIWGFFKNLLRKSRFD